MSFSTAVLALVMECAPAVSPDTMAAIVMQESDANPLALNIEYKEYYPKTKKEATDLLNEADKKGHRYAAGLGQIWHTNFKSLGLDNENVFDACTNLKAAQAVLLGNYAREIRKTKNPVLALSNSISQYYSGNNQQGWENGYIQSVVKKVTDNDIKVPSASILVDLVDYRRKVNEAAVEVVHNGKTDDFDKGLNLVWVDDDENTTKDVNGEVEAVAVAVVAVNETKNSRKSSAKKIKKRVKEQPKKAIKKSSRKKGAVRVSWDAADKLESVKAKPVQAKNGFSQKQNWGVSRNGFTK